MTRIDLRLAVPWIAILELSLSLGCASAAEDRTITLNVNDSIQAIVEDSPEGARFLLEPGVYRQQTVYPKNRQQFIGQDGVILNGAMELKTWSKEGALWITGGLPTPLPIRGECGRELCALREDLFFDGRLYRRVGSLDALGSGEWYYQDGRAYLADDPTGQTIELSVTPLAFGGDAEGVVLKDLIIEKYASQAQHGAIDIRNGREWRLSNITARWNHGMGLYIGPGTHVERGSFSNNGQLGMGGRGDGTVIQGVEIAFNNYAGYEGGWEAGGAKFTRTKGLVVRNSCVHHNVGPGLWTDIDNFNVLYDLNTVFLNGGDGIKHEISYDAIIRNNSVARNGNLHDVWLWGSQILIQNSSNVEVYGNSVQIAAGFGNGIGVVHQSRGDGEYGPVDAVNNRVHHNTIVHLGLEGMSGAAADADREWFWDQASNVFDWNRYVVVRPATRNWAFSDSARDWNEVQKLGHERNGQLIVEQRAPMELSCAE